MLRSDLCNYREVYTVAKETINIQTVWNNAMPRKNNLFKNKAPFRSCISKISNAFIDNAEELDIVMPMCNL